MASSDSGSAGVECGVGAIVWVRRRNGSWWPGKILGPDELSASHLMSPRSGTPVKLLGREDASVDWYNLEKSKRVKPFRCGEFDDCIERAEASLGMPPKKREKYARREDAILHALELEKQLLEKKRGKLDCSSTRKSSKVSADVKIELGTSSESLGYDNGESMHPKSCQLLTRIELNPEDKSKGHHSYAQRIKEGKQLCGSHENSDVVPRMRGLQDLGLRTAPSKHKLPSEVAADDYQKDASDDRCHAPLNDGLSTEGTIRANNTSFLDKRKRFHDGLVEEFPVKRRDRRRPLLHVLETTAKLSDLCSLHPDDGSGHLSVSGEEPPGRSSYAFPTAESSDLLEDKEIHPDRVEILSSKFEENCSHPAFSSEENASGSTEDTETDSSETDSLESDMDEVLSDDAASIELKPKYLERFEVQGENRSLSCEEPDDLAVSSDLSHSFSNDLVSASVGVSKWQLKGKRNNRSLTKRSIDVSGRKYFKGPTHGIDLREKELYDYYEADAIDNNFRTRMGGYRSRGVDGGSHNIIDWEDLTWNDQPALKGYWEDSGQCFDPVIVSHRHFGGQMKSMLIDVDLKVQSSYQREHVPMISLMSKLNGQAIVGHPIHIEALENGSSETLLAATNVYGPEDNDTVLPPVWKTARRTANVRIPRPRPSLDGDETAEHAQYLDQDRSLSLRKSSGGHKARMMSKSLYNSSCLSLDKKLPRKPLKKISLSSNQKTRTLSSIAIQQKHNNDLKHGSNSYQVGLIKPEFVPTAVACIPVKLVFSRLHEELIGRH